MFYFFDFSDLWLKENIKLKVMEGVKGNFFDVDSERVVYVIKKLVISLIDRYILIVLIFGNYY